MGGCVWLGVNVLAEVGIATTFSLIPEIFLHSSERHEKASTIISQNTTFIRARGRENVVDRIWFVQGYQLVIHMKY